VCVDYTVVFFTDSAFVRVKPERQGVSYQAASCGPLAAPSTSLRRVALAHEPSARRPPRRTATLSVNQDVVRPTPIGQVFFSIFYSAADRVAEYCEELVCLSVCVCVCLSAIISSDLHVRSSPVFCACYLWPWLGPPLTA